MQRLCFYLLSIAVWAAIGSIPAHGVEGQPPDDNADDRPSLAELSVWAGNLQERACLQRFAQTVRFQSKSKNAEDTSEVTEDTLALADVITADPDGYRLRVMFHTLRPDGEKLSSALKNLPENSAWRFKSHSARLWPGADLVIAETYLEDDSEWPLVAQAVCSLSKLHSAQMTDWTVSKNGTVFDGYSTNIISDEIRATVPRPLRW